METARWAAVILCLLPGMAACAGELEGDENNYRVTSGSGSCADVPALLAGKCGQNFCHGGTDPAQDLDLRSPDVATRLVGVNAHSENCTTRLLIAPAGSGTTSFLLEKLTSSTPECGDPMPPVGEISAGERACIETWIAGLAGAGGPGDAAGVPGDALPSAPGAGGAGGGP